MQTLESDIMLAPTEDEDCQYDFICPEGWWEFQNNGKKWCIKSMGLSNFDNDLCAAQGARRLYMTLDDSNTNWDKNLATALDGSEFGELCIHFRYDAQHSCTHLGP